MSAKEDKQFAVSVAILEIIEADGLLGVTHSKVSRKSGVSRAWIYEYIGKDKSELIEYGADVFASHIARAKLAELPRNREELSAQLKSATTFLFDAVEQNPLIIKLYFRFRGSQNPVGKVIQKYEKQWLATAVKTLTTVVGLAPDQAATLAEFVLTVRLGYAHRLATSSNAKLARAAAEKTFDMIHTMIGG